MVNDFLGLLKQSPSGAVFNPWWQIDRANDAGPEAPQIRREQLQAYLRARVKTARVVIIGEALGYRGGHFTGIAMTSERLLLNRHERVSIPPDSITPSLEPRRTSNPKTWPLGFSEPTATIVWSELLAGGLHPPEFVLWNAFPWHSFNPEVGLLSNRMPTKAEQAAGLPALMFSFRIFPAGKTIALGQIAASQIQKLGRQADCVRHPASGGAKLFRRQIKQLLK